MALPAWLSTMQHVPAAMPVTVLPLVPPVVQTEVVVELNVTGLPDAPPVAYTVPVPPTISVGALPKLMVWLPMPMAKLWVVWVAEL